jgi:hypothetical protein
MLSATTLDFPKPFTAYPGASPDGLLATLLDRISLEPFNVVATAIFLCAIIHTFAAARFAAMAHAWQHRHDARARAAGRPTRPSVIAETLHFLGEVEVVFGLWAVVLAVPVIVWVGWDAATHHLNGAVDYTEAMFVVVIMTLASPRPIITFT